MSLALAYVKIIALPGNAFAGGLILALCCDVRLGAAGPSRFAINEVPVGIPMPGVYTEMVRHAVGTAAAQEAILSGRVYDLEQARALGFVHRVVPAAELLDEAVKEAAIIKPDCLAAYAASKRAATVRGVLLCRPTKARLSARQSLRPATSTWC